ncbi:MAG: hypothetical protein V4689_22635 [Verrucomicrobiota bacterium]
MQHATITNALIRCTRSDREAAASFELVREDIGLWVLELDPGPGATLSEQIAEIYGQLQMRSTELRNLREGSLDYTLHLTFDLPDIVPIILPTALSDLASDCAFEFEIYVNTIKDG